MGYISRPDYVTLKVRRARIVLSVIVAIEDVPVPADARATRFAIALARRAAPAVGVAVSVPRPSMLARYGIRATTKIDASHGYHT